MVKCLKFFLFSQPSATAGLSLSVFLKIYVQDILLYMRFHTVKFSGKSYYINYMYKTIYIIDT